MTIIMTILGAVAAIAVLFLLVAAVTGKDMSIERSIAINRPANEVYDFVRHIKNHEQFSTWHMMDPQMKKTYRGTDGQVGFVYSWDSVNDKNVGAGEQEITKLVPGERVEFHLRFLRPMQSEADATMVLSSSANGQTTVQWTFAGPMKFPMNAMKSVLSNMLGKQLAAGLENLKKVLES